MIALPCAVSDVAIGVRSSDQPVGRTVVGNAGYRERVLRGLSSREETRQEVGNSSATDATRRTENSTGGNPESPRNSPFQCP